MRIHGGGNHKIQIPGESLAPISLFELSALLSLCGIGAYNPEYNLQFASPLYIFNPPSRDLVFHQNSPTLFPLFSSSSSLTSLPPASFFLQPAPYYYTRQSDTVHSHKTAKKTSTRRACCLLGSKVSRCPRHTTTPAVTYHISLLTLPCLTLPCFI